MKGKLDEKDKGLRFQDSTKIVDDIISSQGSPSIKTRVGFYETVEGESNSQGEGRNSNAKSEMINKEISGQPSSNQGKKFFKENLLLLTVEVINNYFLQ